MRSINLALQGGGAHGAFTWGVLDVLLEEPDLHIEGLSGSSAGAMNAVLFADGWMKGGREGASASLKAFWTEIGKQMPAGLMSQRQDDQIRSGRAVNARDAAVSMAGNLLSCATQSL